jgi:curved DNA-binding protein
VTFKDYYRILGVPKKASEEDIKRAFRKLAREHHPDVAKDKKASEERFKEVNEAYEVLGDPAKRAKYDALGSDWATEGLAGSGGRAGGRHRTRTGGGAPDFEYRFGGTGFSDFFEQFFGGRGGGDVEDLMGHSRTGRGRFAGEGRGQRRGADGEGTLLVTLDEALHGSVRSVSVQRADAHGGAGETHTFRVRIPTGVRDGQVIRVPGQGWRGSGGGEAGDLYLTVRLAAHPDFQVREADLTCELTVAPWELVLGAMVEVPTLEGRVTLRIPAGTQNGRQFRVRGRGMPRGGDQEGRGDLYVTVQVQLPEDISVAERELWEQLARISTCRPRET